VELEEVPMLIVGGLGIHRKQIIFDYLDTVTGEVKLGQIARATAIGRRGRSTTAVPDLFAPDAAEPLSGVYPASLAAAWQRSGLYHEELGRYGPVVRS
jgi:hypothetical protein